MTRKLRVTVMMRRKVLTLFIEFLWFDVYGYPGPAAHVQVMEHKVQLPKSRLLYPGSPLATPDKLDHRLFLIFFLIYCV